MRPFYLLFFSCYLLLGGCTDPLRMSYTENTSSIPESIVDPGDTLSVKQAGVKEDEIRASNVARDYEKRLKEKFPPHTSITKIERYLNGEGFLCGLADEVRGKSCRQTKILKAYGWYSWPFEHTERKYDIAVQLQSDHLERLEVLNVFVTLVEVLQQ